MDNKERVYSNSINKFWGLFLVINCLTIIVGYIFDEYDFVTHMLTLGVFDIVVLFYVFCKQKVKRVEVYEKDKEAVIVFSYLFGRRKKKRIIIDELRIKYEEEQVSRATRYRILKLFDNEGNIICQISPSLMIWDKATIDELTRDLLSLKEVQGNKLPK
ncbi:hypothetical protein [Phaeodactylibacter xiamenensis]|jgi:hypothetical protein|uniref:hypothetical protein n=2 Tax=Phaeodactylibacter xiamenensis TaxID=1524460 RepID=UPI003BABF01B